MRSGKLLLLLLLLALVTGCPSSSGGGPVPGPTLTSISISPANPSVALGVTQQFIAQGTYSDNSTRNVTASATWSSSAPGVATVSNAAASHGLAASLAMGQTRITASVGNVSGFSDLTIGPAVLVSLIVTPPNTAIAPGTAKQFIATGIYSDRTSSILTTAATWTSSSPDVALVSNASGSQGLATAIASGTAAITAWSGSIRGAASLTVTGGGSAAANVLPITVNGSLCSANSYVNKPCVSVTVCTPGTAICQTIDDILLDTGSFGLRIFKQALTVPLTPVTIGSRSIAECVQFGGGTSDWGPVEIADVVLGGEQAVQVPIHVIDYLFGTSTLPAACSNADKTPLDAGFNGILGVGLFSEDCGLFCESFANNGMYYSCSGSSCIGSNLSRGSQVRNPVALLPVDNNGVIVHLPSVASSGATSVNGTLVLGIGTQVNNQPVGEVVAFDADQYGDIITIFNNTTYASFIDSGSNGLFFDASSTSALPDCGPAAPGWFCPSSIYTDPATINKGNQLGSPSQTVSFQIENTLTLANSINNVFPDLGGSAPGMFDWGLPFYLGRSVYVGIENTPSCLGTGPYFAY